MLNTFFCFCSAINLGGKKQESIFEERQKERGKEKQRKKWRLVFRLNNPGEEIPESANIMRMRS